jgi:hypothetical protein
MQRVCPGLTAEGQRAQSTQSRTRVWNDREGAEQTRNYRHGAKGREHAKVQAPARASVRLLRNRASATGLLESATLKAPSS